MGLPKSARLLMATSKKALARPGVARRRVTGLNRYQPLAPKFCAASSRLGLIHFKTPEMVIYAKGKKAIVCTTHKPKGPYRSTFRCSRFQVIKPRRPKSMIKARPDTTDGAMVGSRATIWKKRFQGMSV